MKKYLFTRTVAVGMALMMALGCIGGVSATEQLLVDSANVSAGDSLGAAWSAESTTFRFWAPNATEMQVNLYRSGLHGTKDRIDPYPMTRDANGIWTTTIPGDLNGFYYTYQGKVNGSGMETCDPYASSTGINGQRAMILNLDSTDPEGWEQDTGVNTAANAVIYELDIQGTEGGYLGLAETASQWLSPVVRLGATHLELPAFYDCDGLNENGGQTFVNGAQPLNYNAPEGAYASNANDGAVRVKELKQLIQVIHNYGLSVVLDVDYAQVIDGMGQQASQYVVDSICYWADEYHIDGFRLENMDKMDAEMVNAIAEAVHVNHPEVLIYGENVAFAAETTGVSYIGGEAGQCVNVIDGQKLSAVQALVSEDVVLIPAGVEVPAELAEYWAGLMEFRQAREAIASEVSQIISIVNEEADAQEVSLDPGQWEVYINGETAGITKLDAVEGSVTVEPGTAMVLVQKLAPTEPPVVEEPTEAPTEPSGDFKDKLMDLAQQLLPYVYVVLPYLDLIAAGVLIVLSGAIIIVVIYMKKQK